MKCRTAEVHSFYRNCRECGLYAGRRGSPSQDGGEVVGVDDDGDRFEVTVVDNGIFEAGLPCECRKAERPQQFRSMGR